jgi:quercetin 2,3-dioxygenase
MMGGNMKTRSIRKILKAIPTLEGAGVHLNRAFGNSHIPEFDPFLMLDDFRSDDPDKYIKGFPWHPHRGIETITYLLEGTVEHGDSMGNNDVIRAGGVQWMTAGSGIIHQEMPKGDEKGRMYGFQLWANLPAAQKMMKPRYRDIKNQDIPVYVSKENVKIKVVSGKFDDVIGPVTDIITDPEYLDISMPVNCKFEHETKNGYTAFAYVIDGEASFSDTDTDLYNNRNVILFSDGDKITITTKNNPVRFLFLSGKPLNEPVAWGGPIVMNTKEELRLAFQELDDGTFIK